MSAQVPADRLRDLRSVTDAALAYLPLEDLLKTLLGRVVAILDADTAAILLLEDDDKTLAARAARGLEQEVERGVRIPVGKGFAGRIAATRQPVQIENIDEAEIVNPILREKGLRSLLGVPLLVQGRRGQYERTAPEGTVHAAGPGAGAGRLRRPGAVAGEGHA